MRNIFGIAVCRSFWVMAGTAQAQQREKIIIDTDIGDDIDDAFAVGLALSSPEFEILGVSATFGDTVDAGEMFDRMLGELGRSDIPVAMGRPPMSTATPSPSAAMPKAAAWRCARHPNAVDFVLDQARKYPGQVTLVAIGPLPNSGP